MASEGTVVVTVSREGWVDLAHVPDGVRVEVYDFGSETKTEELVQQEVEEALERVRGHADADGGACGAETAGGRIVREVPWARFEIR